MSDNTFQSFYLFENPYFYLRIYDNQHGHSVRAQAYIAYIDKNIYWYPAYKKISPEKILSIQYMSPIKSQQYLK